MNVILFGATGMIGQGVLRECLRDPGVASVLAIGRSATGQQHPKLREVLHRDFFDYSALEGELAGFDACFFCLGVSSLGMTEERYTRLTHDLTLAAARALARLNPEMTFIYISGMGADSSERGRVMWARVRGKLENELLRLPFKAAYIFRPAMVQPLTGVRPKGKYLPYLYKGLAPLLALLGPRLPKMITTTERIGRAMLLAVRQGAPKSILENKDINALADQGVAKMR